MKPTEPDQPTSDRRKVVEILIVEDRDSLRHVLPTALELESDFHTCASARSAEEALECMKKKIPDLALIDLALPGMDGIELVTLIKKEYPGTCCVMLSGHEEPRFAESAIEAGASGYILKGRPGEMIDGIRQALAGEIYLSGALRQLVSNAQARGES